MPEEVKIRIIYILVMIVPVFVYFCIGGILSKSFKKHLTILRNRKRRGAALLTS